MSLPAFASLEDLASRIPAGIAVADEARAQAALDDASALIRLEAGKDWAEGDELDPDIPPIVVTVTTAVARRAFVNPDGLTQETTGPFSVSVSNASADIYLTKTERALLRRAAGRFELTSVRVEAPAGAAASRWDDLSELEDAEDA